MSVSVDQLVTHVELLIDQRKRKLTELAEIDGHIRKVCGGADLSDEAAAKLHTNGKVKATERPEGVLPRVPLKPPALTKTWAAKVLGALDVLEDPLAAPGDQQWVTIVALLGTIQRVFKIKMTEGIKSTIYGTLATMAKRGDVQRKKGPDGYVVRRKS